MLHILPSIESGLEAAAALTLSVNISPDELIHPSLLRMTPLVSGQSSCEV